jgi:hypothetical protein
MKSEISRWSYYVDYGHWPNFIANTILQHYYKSLSIYSVGNNKALLLFMSNSFIKCSRECSNLLLIILKISKSGRVSATLFCFKVVGNVRVQKLQ